jgi:hypothetical protein
MYNPLLPSDVQPASCPTQDFDVQGDRACHSLWLLTTRNVAQLVESCPRSSNIATPRLKLGPSHADAVVRGGAGRCLLRVDAIIPALNEAETVATVARVARAAPSLRNVIVVDGGSIDGTAEAVETVPGAHVLRREPGYGKGESLGAGVDLAADADIVVFLDADLVGLTTGHVEWLVAAVRDGGNAMACGLFDRGPLINPFFLHVFPILTGQRALRRELFCALQASDVRGYKVEAALNSLCDRAGLPTSAAVLPGLWHRTKEEKRGIIRGFAQKQAMLATAMWSYVSFHVKHRLPSRSLPHPSLGSDTPDLTCGPAAETYAKAS